MDSLRASLDPVYALTTELAQAEAILSRAAKEGTITYQERDRLMDLLRDKQQAYFDGVRGSIDSTVAAENELRAMEQELNIGVATGNLSIEERNRLLDTMQLQLREQLDPLGAMLDDIRRESELLDLTEDQRRVEIASYNFV